MLTIRRCPPRRRLPQPRSHARPVELGGLGRCPAPGVAGFGIAVALGAARLGLVALLMATAPALGQITEFPVPTASAGVSEITAGPGGSLWFLETNGNRIGRITTAGVVSELELPGSPEFPALAVGLAAGPDGNLWFTEYTTSRITRMTPAGAFTRFPLPGTLREPKGITTGPGGLWFTEELGNRIGRITTAGVITEFAIPAGFAGLSAITAGPDGNLWFTEAARDRIGRITPTGTVTEFNLPASSAGLGSITSGPDGNLWFTEAGRDRIGRITPAGVITEFVLPSGARPLDIVAGPDGNLWFTQNGDAKIGRITTAGVATSFATPTADSHPVGIAIGPDGNVWFTAAKANKVGRLGDGGGNTEPCVEGATTLCLAADRFEISVRWTTSTGATGDGKAVPLTADTGYFWFFDAANVELVLKVLDGRAVNGAWWVFYGALSDVRYTITVTDTETGGVKTYENAQGNLASIADTGALPEASLGAFSLLTGAPASPGELEDLLALAAADEGFAPSPTAVPASTGNGSPVGSTYEIETLLAEDVDGDGGGDLFRICAGAGDFAVTFDGTTENLPPYTCSGNTTPRVSETFTDHANGTATVEIKVVSANGADLFPGGLIGDGVALEGAALRVGFLTGSDALDWTPGHQVQAATLDLRANGASVSSGGPEELDPELFFGAPGDWDGHFGIFYAGRAGDGIDEVILRLTVEHPTTGGGACVADATHLCLKGDRFRVSVAWQTPAGATGDGKGVELTADTGYFWFFNAANVELVLKILDGRPINGFWWVFYGALSNVQYTISIQDTTTGQVKTYVNPQGRLASVADTRALQ